jgi:cytochrome c peroxidase
MHRRGRRLTKWLARGAALGVASLFLVAGYMFVADRSSAEQDASTLDDEIAAIEEQIDAIEADALAKVPDVLPGSPQRLPALGKILFFDKHLSVNRNEACAFCHMPQTGFQGAHRKPE